MRNGKLCTITAVVSWVCMEIFYFAYIKWRVAPKLCPKTSRYPFRFNDPVNMVLGVYETLLRLNTYSFESFVSKFFLNAPICEIHAGNFESFLSWAVYRDSFINLSVSERDVVALLRDKASELFCITWKEGYNPTIQHIQCGIEELHYIHLPLTYSLVVKGFERGIEYYFIHKYGFQLYQSPSSSSISYFIRVHSQSTKPPVILFHGICTGWSNFNKMIQTLICDRTVILFNYACTKRHSMRFEVPSADEVANSVEMILWTHAIARVSLIGSSWGTFLVGWVARLKPHLVAHITLLDPVTLNVFLPDTIYTILYKPCQTIMDYLLHVCVRRDLTIANTLCRMVWYNVSVCLSELSGDIGITVGISSDDLFISVPTTIELVKQSNGTRVVDGKKPVQLFVWEEMAHGDSVYTSRCIQEVIRELDARTCEK